MKNLLIIIAILFTGALIAQEQKPLFEKEGDVIKGTYYFENGEISQQGYYNKEGKLHGEWKAYDTSGKKISLGYYTNGVKTGKWFFWNNEKSSEVNFADNSIAKVTTWYNKSDVATTYNGN